MNCILDFDLSRQKVQNLFWQRAVFRLIISQILFIFCNISVILNLNLGKNYVKCLKLTGRPLMHLAGKFKQTVLNRNEVFK